MTTTFKKGWNKWLYQHGDGTWEIRAIFCREEPLESWGWVSKHYAENDKTLMDDFMRIKGSTMKSDRFREDWEAL